MSRKIALFLFSFLFLLGCGLTDSIQRPVDSNVPELILLDGDGQIGVITKTLAEPLRVMAKNSNGDPLPEEEIEFVVEEGGGGIILDTSVITDQEGIAETAITLGTTPGPVVIRATLLPNPLDDPKRTVRFNLVSASIALKVISGLESQAGERVCAGEGQRYPEELVIEVTDENDEPISDIELLIDPMNAAIDDVPFEVSASRTTDENGLVSLSVTAGSVSGDGYDDDVVVTVSASSVVAAPIVALYEVTKNEFLIPLSEPIQYGTNNPTDIFNFSVQLLAACGEVSVGENISFEVSIYLGCTDDELFSDFSLVEQIATDQDGIATRSSPFIFGNPEGTFLHFHIRGVVSGLDPVEFEAKENSCL